MSKEIKELQRIRSILSYVTGFEDDDQENIEDARKSVGRVIDSLAEQPAQRTWVGLTEAEIKTSLPYSVTRDKGCFHAGALWAEAKLKEKNT